MLKSELRAMEDVLYFVSEPSLLNAPWLWPKQKEVLSGFYDPKKQFRDMILIWGMRGGKTTVASVIACFEAFKLINMGYPCRKYGLPKGTEIFIINVATSDRQARDTVFAHTKARIDNSPWFQRQKYTEHFNEFIFPVKDGRVIVRSEHSNSASLAGKTVICVTFDELSRFKDTGGNSSAEMVYDTLSRSVRTFGHDGKRVVITSPMYQGDFAMELYNLYKNNERWFCRRWPTWEVNPTITFENLEDEFAKDPETAWRDYGATPSASLEVYFKEPSKIEICMTEKKNPVNPEGVTPTDQLKDFKGIKGIPYTLAGDPALKNDAFGLALVHIDNKTDFVICDLLHRFTAHNTREEGDQTKTAREVNAGFVREFIHELNKRCWIETFLTDTWQFPETIQSIRADGIEVEQNHVTKTEYDRLKELMYTKRIELPHYPFVIEELKGLELKRGERVDHPRSGSKDVADALANATWYATSSPAASEEPIAVSFGL
jgi:hypothetical protein